MRLKTGYLDKKAASIEEAMRILGEAQAPVSVGLQGNAAELLPKLLPGPKIDYLRRVAKAGGPLPCAAHGGMGRSLRTRAEKTCCRAVDRSRPPLRSFARQAHFKRTPGVRLQFLRLLDAHDRAGRGFGRKSGAIRIDSRSEVMQSCVWP